ncbi:type IV secretion system protein, partial [Thiolapillus sp.]
MKKFILSILFVASINTANAGGIPVFDGVNLAQNIQQVMHALETINQLKEQLDKMKEQLKVAEDALASMSDPRGYASIIQSTYSMDT